MLNMSESDILYENGKYWVCKSEKVGYEVYRDGVTHSTRCAIIGYGGDEGLTRAKAECDRRANQAHKERITELRTAEP